MDIKNAYERLWCYAAPRKCREMHDANLFNPNAPRSLRLAVFEVYDGDKIAKGDVYVAENLAAGLVPIGGDSSGDRWCFDTRLRIGGTTPVLNCPHDGSGATYEAPSFTAFIYRLVLENLVHAHIFEGRGVDRRGLVALTLENLALLSPWLLRRWVRRAKEALAGPWPTHESFDGWMREDPAFRRLPEGEHEHFRPMD
jgi:hypothetical protein